MFTMDSIAQYPYFVNTLKIIYLYFKVLVPFVTKLAFILMDSSLPITNSWEEMICIIDIDHLKRGESTKKDVAVRGDQRPPASQPRISRKEDGDRPSRNRVEKASIPSPVRLGLGPGTFSQRDRDHKLLALA